MKRTMVGGKCPQSVEVSSDRNSYNVLRFAVFCVFALMIAPAVHGQATGSFSGNVLDKSGSAVPGAALKLPRREPAWLETRNGRMPDTI